MNSEDKAQAVQKLAKGSFKHIIANSFHIVIEFAIVNNKFTQIGLRVSHLQHSFPPKKMHLTVSSAEAVCCK